MSQSPEKTSGAKAIGKVVAALAVVAMLVAAIGIAASILAPQAKAQGAASLRDAIVQSANQCYAIEGSYPYSLSYLEDNYGLVVNHDGYSVTYEVFADNVAPNVMVVER